MSHFCLEVFVRKMKEKVWINKVCESGRRDLIMYRIARIPTFLSLILIMCLESTKILNTLSEFKSNRNFPVSKQMLWSLQRWCLKQNKIVYNINFLYDKCNIFYEMLFFKLNINTYITSISLWWPAPQLLGITSYNSIVLFFSF